jgi:CheY-like chemotaxis protein
VSTSPTSPTETPRQVGILVLDNDPEGASTVKQILDSEGWRVRIVPDTQLLLAELKTGEYLIPELAGAQYMGPLELARLPYVVRPYHLHDFLEKISDLLVEVKAIDGPIRQVRREFGALRKKKKQLGRTSMFASRDSYTYTEEELAEYERAEIEASKTKRNKPKTNLGGSDR